MGSENGGAARTIRNCPLIRESRVAAEYELQAVGCPMRWEQLASTASPSIRHCSACAQDVYWCRTDEETLDHALRGHCIAREMPPAHCPGGTGEVRFVGMVSVAAIEVPPAPPPPSHTPDAYVAARAREHAIDEAIAVVRSRLRCPRCHFPVIPWRSACKLCGEPVTPLADDVAWAPAPPWEETATPDPGDAPNSHTPCEGQKEIST